MNDESSLGMVRIVLNWIWDPFGMRGTDRAAREYDIYAAPVVELLEANASDEQISEYLASVVGDRMERTVSSERHTEVSSILRELYAFSREGIGSKLPSQNRWSADQR